MGQRTSILVQNVCVTWWRGQAVVLVGESRCMLLKPGRAVGRPQGTPPAKGPHTERVWLCVWDRMLGRAPPEKTDGGGSATAVILA